MPDKPDKPDTFFLKSEEQPFWHAGGSWRARLSGGQASTAIGVRLLAATAVWLANQPRSAWTFEAVVRPFGENW